MNNLLHTNPEIRDINGLIQKVFVVTSNLRDDVRGGYKRDLKVKLSKDSGKLSKIGLKPLKG